MNRYTLPVIVVCLILLRQANAQFVQQGNKLLGSDAVGSAFQGISVSLSSDGNTAIVGGIGDNSLAGAAWVWTRSDGVWTQEGTKLVGSGAVGGAFQGWSASLSSDGNTAIVGGPGDNSSEGAAWVWTRSGGVWTQEGEKLVGTGAVGSAQQGLSVSLSSDGNTAIVGGNQDNSLAGAAWVWTRSGGVWTQEGEKLVGTGAVGGAEQGVSVSLSADGNTAIVGGRGDNSSAGAAWVWTRSGGVWTQEGLKLVGTGAVGIAEQGVSVSLSADGNTAIVGGNQDNSLAGAVWVWTRSGGVWTQEGLKLVGTGAVGLAEQGVSVSLSADGNTAIVGGYQDNSSAGAAWVWTRSGGEWTQQGTKRVGTGAVGGAEQGASISLSSDGNTAIIGGYQDNTSAGAAWVFAATKVRYVSTTGTDDGNCTQQGNPCATIAYTISQSVDEDTIQIAAGTYTEAGILIDKNLTLSGADQATTVIQAHESGGSATDRVLDINTAGTVNILNVTVRHGRQTSSEGGGGIRIANSTATLTDVTVTANRATAGAGGGFRIMGGMVTLTGVTVTGDSALQGGGIFVTSGAALEIIGGSVSGNSNTGIDQFGGGIYANGSGATLDISAGTTINNNSNNKNGGGIAVNNGAKATLDEVTFSGNSSTAGGGVWLNQISTVFTLTNSTISNNSSISGGGIFTGGNAKATIEGVTFNTNSAVTGGGIHIGSGNLNVSFSSFTNNTVQAINHGGGTVTAKRNWWGDASGPTIASNPGGIGQVITGTVAYAPWFGAVAGTSPMTFGLDQTGSLSETIGFASANDSIQIKAGTYTEQGLSLNKNLTLFGAGAGDDPGVHTIIQAHADSGAATDRVMTISGGLAVMVGISDVKIRHGNIDGNGGGISNDATLALSGVTVSGNAAFGVIRYGGGIRNDGTLTLTGSIVVGNSAVQRGGGIYNSGPATLTITGSAVSGNTGPGFNLAGAGIYNEGMLGITGSIIGGDAPGDANTTAFNGGGIYNTGTATLGGTWDGSNFLPGDPVTLSSNSAGGSGGGIYNTGDLTVFGGAVRGGSATFGGGIVSFGPLGMNGVSISGNSATSDGGGIYNSVNATITNSTFSGNTAGLGGGIHVDESNPSITNCIFWGNSSDQISNSSGTPTISYSNIQGSGGSDSWDTGLGTDGGGNIDSDPLFVDPRPAEDAPSTEGDYRLQAGSPSINEGSNTPVTTIHDADGNSRIVGGTVDMGAYEYQSALYSVSRQVTENSTVYEFGNTQVSLAFSGIAVDEAVYVFVDYHNSGAESPTFTGPEPVNQSTYRWVITKTGSGFTDASVAFTDVSSLPGVTDPSTVTIYSRPTPGSGDFSALATTLDVDDLSTTVTSFSEFIFGSDDESNSLPVQMTSFMASANRLNAELVWRTETEAGNHGFEVERREMGLILTDTRRYESENDGVASTQQRHSLPFTLYSSPWATIGFVQGAGTSSSPRDYSFVDQQVSPGRYAYRIKQIDRSGAFVYTNAVELDVGLAPMEFNLAQNYPNPFNPTTTIEFTLPQDGRVVLKIYDLQGQELATLVDEDRRAGVYHQVVFDASRFASGLYFSRLQSGNLQSIKKLVLVK